MERNDATLPRQGLPPMTRKELDFDRERLFFKFLQLEARCIRDTTVRQADQWFTKIERTRDYSLKRPVVFLSLKWCEIIANQV